MTAPVAFAAVAHPDDIEFMMAGTLILLARRGWEVHIMNIANGGCGSATLDRDTIARMRTEEARAAAASIGAHFHPPICQDADIFYDRPTLARLAAIVRRVRPTILLLQSPQDYMEDHMNSSRLMVTAAFCRAMPNFPTDPPTPVTDQPIGVYHALPYGLCDQLRHPIRPDFCVEIHEVLAEKRAMLACHRSQKEWLDHSQGLDAYLDTMVQMAREVGRISGSFELAEGWRRHSYLGFGDESFDPLHDALADRIAPC